MKYRTVFLDANLFVLLVVGRVSPAYIEKHKRLRAYDADAFTLLGTLLNGFDALVATPNVLTETSNLLGGRDSQAGRQLTSVFQTIVDAVVEVVIPSKEAVRRPEFQWLGLADAATLEVLSDDMVLLTDDQPLFATALQAGCKAELFSALRGRAAA